MRQTVWRTLVILACVVSVHCGGGSDSTGTAPSQTTGSTGGSGGTSGGGSGGGSDTFRVTLPISDSFFDDGVWDDVVEAYSANGGGSGGHLTFNGQEGAGYRQVSIHIDSGSNPQLAVFAIRRDVVYFPSTDGAILWIDYSESSINQAGGAQYSAPALRQNGKLYTLVPGGGAFTTPDASWTDHSLTHLTQSDFRTIASATDHPDFSTGRIEVGFMRLQAGLGATKGGIDNYRMVLYRK